MSDQTEETLKLMAGPDGPKIVGDDVVVEKIEGDRVTFQAPAPQQVSYGEATARAMQRAFTAKAAIDAEAREQLAAQRAEGPKTRTHTSEEAQKGDAFRRSMNAHRGTIREAELRRGVPEREATSLLAEPVAPKDEPFLDNTEGPGPVI